MSILSELTPVFVCILSWQALYWTILFISPCVSSSFQKLDEEKGEKGYWASSWVSTIHAIVIVPACIVAFWQEPLLLYSDDFFLQTPISLMAMRIFLGYILSDITVSLYYNSLWAGWQANMVHHFCVAFVWMSAVLGEYMHGVGCVMMAMEITTCSVNLRWFLSKMDMSSGLLYLGNGITMIVMWFIFRIVGYIYAAWLLYNQREGLFSEKVPDISRVAFLGTFSIGFFLMVFWFQKMVAGALKVLRGGDGGGNDAEKKPLGSRIEEEDL